MDLCSHHQDLLLHWLLGSPTQTEDGRSTSWELRAGRGWSTLGRIPGAICAQSSLQQVGVHHPCRPALPSEPLCGTVHRSVGGGHCLWQVTLNMPLRPESGVRTLPRQPGTGGGDGRAAPGLGPQHVAFTCDLPRAGETPSCSLSVPLKGLASLKNLK